MLSFAVTAYEEMSEPQQYGKRLLDCIEAACNHPAINEIVVVNDGPEGFHDLRQLLGGTPKLKLFSNNERMGVFTNKIEAVARCTGDWVINCDSDNVMNEEYIDHAVGLPRDPETWYCPSFAKPAFDYRGLVGRWDVAELHANGFFDLAIAACQINTGNQIVNRHKYMAIFERFRGIRRFDLLLPNYLGLPEQDRVTEDTHLAYGACDSLLINIEWLLHGGTIEIVEGLEYDHTVHKDRSGSNYDRAPVIKERLGEILRDRLARGVFRMPK